MDLRSTVASAVRNIRNLRGWSGKKRIVVIESDDWGSIRMPSRQVYQDFVAKGFPVQHSQYNRLDCLETNDDLEALFEVLSSVRDSAGRYARLTANTIVANPD